ncbi:ninjurin-B-like [Paramacrobiotus metropolitanus]|uniref:ninjurin-B-like n=1 Tax=Paramacrobiotus metropolitanus TaxID=2943436 RepID=UPI002445C593|nr:ninjurin-B-like [Paramacrobiotus metropolitanus]
MTTLASVLDQQTKRRSYMSLKDDVDTTEHPESVPFVIRGHVGANGLDQRDGPGSFPATGSGAHATTTAAGSVRLKLGAKRPSATIENENVPLDNEEVAARPHRPRSKSDAAASYASDRSKTSDRELESIERNRKSSNANSNDTPDDAAQSEINIRGNLYQTKKTVAQGLLDIALLTANASQLKNLIETENHPFYTLTMVLLCMSIVLQIVVAVVLLVVGRMDMETSQKQRKKDNKSVVLFNDMAIIGVFLITAVNLFIGIFISHGKAYIPPVDAAASWNQKMFERQKQLWEPTARNASARF